LTDGERESPEASGFGFSPELMAQLLAGGVPDLEELREEPVIDVRYPVVSGDGGYVRLYVIEPSILMPRSRVWFEIGDSSGEKARIDCGDIAGLDLLSQWVREACQRVRPVAKEAWEKEKPFQEQALKLASMRNLSRLFGGG